MPGKKATLWLTITALVFVMASGAFAGRTIYVDADASGANDGSSWQDAYQHLQDALADANSAEKPVEIRVAQGTYKPDQGVTQTLGDREAAFQLINRVTLEGGYAGFYRPDPNARDVDQYQTILSGDLNGDDGPDFIRNAENSYHVVSGSGTEPNALLDGFTITGGNANRHGGYPDFHYTHTFGGGMYNDSGCPTLINCTFRNNRAVQGGGMYNYKSSPALTDCTFSGNRCRQSDDSIYVHHPAGGGMLNLRSDPTLSNCVFSGNSAEDSGGGMCNTDSDAKLMDCRFSHNSAAWGGGIYNLLSSPTLIACAFSANSASGRHYPRLLPVLLDAMDVPGRGGGMENWVSSPTVSNCTFTGNRCSSPCLSPIPPGAGQPAGAGIYNGPDCRLTVTNCIFTGNSALNGDALACSFVWAQGEPSNVELTNCIIWGGSNEIWNNYGSAITIAHSDVQSGQTAIHDPCNAVIWSKSNIDADPCFAEPGYWDPNGTPGDPNDDFWVDGDYHLKSQAGRWEPETQSWVKDDVTSPCIDAGDPATPVGHEQFPNGGIINIGAYGGTAEASKSYFGETVCETIRAGDINGDCKVDFQDFRILAFHWLQEKNR